MAGLRVLSWRAPAPLDSAFRGAGAGMSAARGLVAFGFGMTVQAVALPDSMRSLVFDVLPGSYVTIGATFTVGATVLIECLAAAVSLADSRPHWHLP